LLREIHLDAAVECRPGVAGLGRDRDRLTALLDRDDTYRVIGRSTSITGTYADRAGVDMTFWF
jgi:hypothetical protein